MASDIYNCDIILLLVYKVFVVMDENLQVKSQAMAIAKLIENEDGVTAAVDAFHRHLPPELPLPTPSPVVEDHANPLQWFFVQLAKLCTLPCGSV